MRVKKTRTLFIDIGGTSTKLWIQKGTRPKSRQKKITNPSPALIKKYLSALLDKPQLIVIGSRGVWTRSEKKALKKKFSFLKYPVQAMSDIELSHWCAFTNGPGIVLNAGTGSIAYGRNEKGQTARAGGLGPLVGDEGSAFWIGKEYLKRNARKPREYLKIRKLIKNAGMVKKVAAVAKKVLKNRSPQARQIKLEALRHLRQLAESVRLNLKMKPPVPLQATGGLFQNKKFRLDFLRKLRGYTPVA